MHIVSSGDNLHENITNLFSAESTHSVVSIKSRSNHSGMTWGMNFRQMVTDVAITVESFLTERGKIILDKMM